MAVNGIELAVGQVWRTRGAGPVRIATPLGVNGCFVGVSQEGVRNISPTGRYAGLSDHVFDLVELLSDASAKLQLPFPTIPTAAPLSAPEILDAAAGHMRDRAATYDKPEGERSIAQVVAAFNAIHGTALTEAQGWHFMSILKQVRAFAAAGKPHRDSLEDNVSYSALLGEAMLRGAQ